MNLEFTYDLSRVGDIANVVRTTPAYMTILFLVFGFLFVMLLLFVVFPSIYYRIRAWSALRERRKRRVLAEELILMKEIQQELEQEIRAETIRQGAIKMQQDTQERYG